MFCCSPSVGIRAVPFDETLMVDIQERHVDAYEALLHIISFALFFSWNTGFVCSFPG